jgi:Mce-associated membrane protein
VTDQTRVGSPETGPAEPEATEPTSTEPASTDPATTDAATEQDDADQAPAVQKDPDGAAGGPTGRPTRAVLPLVPVLGALLVLLLAGTAYLVVTRPGTSSVATDDYVDALQAARAGIVDVTSFDYLTLDDDITQIQAVTTGDLTQESVDRLNGSRQALTDAQAVVNTEVVGAAVAAADDRTATVYMVIQSTQTSSASQQAQVQRYRIEVDLTEDGGRWLLSGIQGR